jgi:NAD(P)H-hydrate epimerase
MSGAPRLSGLAALTAGAGRVTLVVPETVAQLVASDVPELMVFSAPATQWGQLSFAALSQIRNHCKNKDVVVMGPGLGRSAGTLLLARRMLEQFDGPMVVDADALLACEGLVPRSNRVFTPHQGEAARFLQTSPDAIARDRVEGAQSLHARLGGCVVLKGSGSLVVSDQKLVRVDVGNASLGKAGSGDVLSGVIAALLGQGLSAFEASATGVWIHGRAADRIHKDRGDRGLTPMGLIQEIPGTMAELS